METIQMPFSRLFKAFVSTVIFAWPLLNSVHACEKPTLQKPMFLEKLSKSGFTMDWTPVVEAKFYALKYTVKIPEGRTLTQREIITERSFHTFLADELPPVESFQLIIEVMAQCGTANSMPAFANIALRNPASACKFDEQIPVLSKGKLTWPPIKEAQAYLICFHADGNRTSCKETAGTHTGIAIGRTSLIGITPVCNNVQGTSVYLSTKSLSDDSQ